MESSRLMLREGGGGLLGLIVGSPSGGGHPRRLIQSPWSLSFGCCLSSPSLGILSRPLAAASVGQLNGPNLQLLSSI